jgi:hypothetical protein
LPYAPRIWFKGSLPFWFQDSGTIRRHCFHPKLSSFVCAILDLELLKDPTTLADYVACLQALNLVTTMKSNGFPQFQGLPSSLPQAQQ